MTAAAVSASGELADHTCATCGHRWSGPVGSPECASAACLAHVQRIARAVGGADAATPEVRILAQIALHQHAELERMRDQVGQRDRDLAAVWERKRELDTTETQLRAELAGARAERDAARKTCSRCAAPLMFSARARGDGLCGPCSRSAQDPLPTGPELGPLELVEDTAVRHVAEYTTPRGTQWCDERRVKVMLAHEPVIARDLPGLLAEVRKLRSGSDLIAVAMRRAVEAFGDQDDGMFNAAGFSKTFTELAGVASPLDGLVVRAMLSGRSDVEMLPGGGHYRLRAGVVLCNLRIAAPQPVSAAPGPDPGLVNALVSALQGLVARVERTGGYASPDEQATLWAGRDALAMAVDAKRRGAA